jgi:transcriptional regulator with XRE-family HTH domain
VNPLQVLIRRRMAEREWSYSDIARRGKLPRSTVQHLANNAHPSRPPHPHTLTRLAEGLDLPAAQVRAAAAQAAGHELPAAAAQDPELALLVADLGRLDPAEVHRIAGYVRALLAESGP